MISVWRGTVEVTRSLGFQYTEWLAPSRRHNTQGKTLAEGRRNLKEAIHLILEENRRLTAGQASDAARREVVSVEL